MDLVYKNERPLFIIALVISIIVWLAIVGFTLGIALIYLPIGGLFYLFAQSAFISYIKGTGVKVSATQYPDLHQRLLDCCQAIGLEKVPDCYVLRTDTFNALATKFLGRHYVVLFSDVVDALVAKPDAINFYIGHELGHIHRKHMRWGLALAPAKLLPLLGAAYSRACESTCDRYGLACCGTAPDAAIAGLVAIGASDSRYLQTDTRSYAAQADESNGFWMSFNELTAGYPWLVKRVAAIEALSQGSEVKHPQRNPGAWFLAFFVPNIGIGGGGVIVLIAIIGILAAVAIPAYKKYQETADLFGGLSSLSNTEYGDNSEPYVPDSETTESLSAEDVRLQLESALQEALPFQQAITTYVAKKKSLPTNGDDLGDELPEQENNVDTYQININEQGAVMVTLLHPDVSDTGLMLEPTLQNGKVSWTCHGVDLTTSALPESCR